MNKNETTFTDRLRTRLGIKKVVQSDDQTTPTEIVESVFHDYHCGEGNDRAFSTVTQEDVAVKYGVKSSTVNKIVNRIAPFENICPDFPKINERVRGAKVFTYNKLYKVFDATHQGHDDNAISRRFNVPIGNVARVRDLAHKAYRDALRLRPQIDPKYKPTDQVYANTDQKKEQEKSDAFAKTLSDVDVQRIKNLAWYSTKTPKEICDMFNISPATFNNIRGGRSRSEVEFKDHWGRVVTEFPVRIKRIDGTYISVHDMQILKRKALDIKKNGKRGDLKQLGIEFNYQSSNLGELRDGTTHQKLVAAPEDWDQYEDIKIEDTEIEDTTTKDEQEKKDMTKPTKNRHLSPDKVLELKKVLWYSTRTLEDIGEEFGINPDTALNIQTGRTRSSVVFKDHWGRDVKYIPRRFGVDRKNGIVLCAHDVQILKREILDAKHTKTTKQSIAEKYGFAKTVSSLWTFTASKKYKDLLPAPKGWDRKEEKEEQPQKETVSAVETTRKKSVRILTKEDVAQIKHELWYTTKSYEQIGEQFGCSHHNIQTIWSGFSHTDVDFYDHWGRKVDKFPYRTRDVSLHDMQILKRKLINIETGDKSRPGHKKRLAKEYNMGESTISRMALGKVRADLVPAPEDWDVADPGIEIVDEPTSNIHSEDDIEVQEHEMKPAEAVEIVEDVEDVEDVEEDNEYSKLSYSEALRELADTVDDLDETVIRRQEIDDEIDELEDKIGTLQRHIANLSA